MSCGSSTVLIDCGFTIKETEKRLQRFQLTPADLTAVLVTHEHGDHIGGVGPFARRHKVPVYSTAGTYFSGRFGALPEHHFISSHQSFALGDLTVCPVPVPHDAKEPVQYVFQGNGKKLGVLTDLGSISRHVIQQYKGCDALLLECNHCPEMLSQGDYPLSLKQRVAGDLGHLSNEQTAQLVAMLSENSQQAWQHLVLAHISEKNNSVEQATKVLAGQLGKARNTLFACQQQGFDWLYIE